MKKRLTIIGIITILSCLLVAPFTLAQTVKVEPETVTVGPTETTTFDVKITGLTNGLKLLTVDLNLPSNIAANITHIEGGNITTDKDGSLKAWSSDSDISPDGKSVKLSVSEWTDKQPFTGTEGTVYKITVKDLSSGETSGPISLSVNEAEDKDGSDITAAVAVQNGTLNINTTQTTHVLDLDISGSGSVTVTTDGTEKGTYNSDNHMEIAKGTSVDMSTTPTSGWQFDGFSGDTPPFTMDSDKATTATFTKVNFWTYYEYTLESVNSTDNTYSLTLEAKTGSEAPPKEDITFHWTFGDGTEATGQNVTHTFDGLGKTYYVTLEATAYGTTEKETDPVMGLGGLSYLLSKSLNQSDNTQLKQIESSLSWSNDSLERIYLASVKAALKVYSLADEYGILSATQLTEALAKAYKSTVPIGSDKLKLGQLNGITSLLQLNQGQTTKMLDQLPGFKQLFSVRQNTGNAEPQQTNVVATLTLPQLYTEIEELATFTEGILDKLAPVVENEAFELQIPTCQGCTPDEYMALDNGDVGALLAYVASVKAGAEALIAYTPGEPVMNNVMVNVNEYGGISLEGTDAVASIIKDNFISARGNGVLDINGDGDGDSDAGFEVLPDSSLTLRNAELLTSAKDNLLQAIGWLKVELNEMPSSPGPHDPQINWPIEVYTPWNGKQVSVDKSDLLDLLGNLEGCLKGNTEINFDLNFDGKTEYSTILNLASIADDPIRDIKKMLPDLVVTQDSSDPLIVLHDSIEGVNDNWKIDGKIDYENKNVSIDFPHPAFDGLLPQADINQLLTYFTFGEVGTKAIKITDATAAINQTAKPKVVLSKAPNGLFSFNIRFSVADTSVAKFTDATISSQFSSASFVVDVASDGSWIQVAAGDFNENMGPGDTDINLANLELKVKTQDTTTVKVDKVKELLDADGDSMGVDASDTGEVGFLAPKVSEGEGPPKSRHGKADLLDDVDGNGTTNSFDAFILFKAHAKGGSVVTNPKYSQYFDFNEDGNPNSYDAFVLFKKIVKNDFGELGQTETATSTASALGTTGTESRIVEVTLNSAPKGLVGYKLSAQVPTGKIEAIDLVAFDGAKVIEGLNSSQATFAACDFNQKVEAKSSDVILTRLKVKGKAPVQLSPHWLDDDVGTSYNLGEVDLGLKRIETSEIQLTLEGISTRPNPLAPQNSIRFTAEGEGIASTKVKVFSLSGEAIYNSGFSMGNNIDWPLEDKQGRKVSNGIYLYAVTAKGFDGELARSEIGKVLVLK